LIKFESLFFDNIDKKLLEVYIMFMNYIGSHERQREVREMFGENALSTQAGMDWRVSGVSDGANFDFEIFNGDLYDITPGGAMYAGFPWRAKLELAGAVVEEDGVAPNPYRKGMIYHDRDIDIVSPGSPDPDFASVCALGSFHRLLKNAQDTTAV
jgi:hypothetical protein